MGTRGWSQRAGGPVSVKVDGEIEIVITKDESRLWQIENGLLLFQLAEHSASQRAERKRGQPGHQSISAA